MTYQEMEKLRRKYRVPPRLAAKLLPVHMLESAPTLSIRKAKQLASLYYR